MVGAPARQPAPLVQPESSSRHLGRPTDHGCLELLHQREVDSPRWRQAELARHVRERIAGVGADHPVDVADLVTEIGEAGLRAPNQRHLLLGGAPLLLGLLCLGWLSLQFGLLLLE